MKKLITIIAPFAATIAMFLMPSTAFASNTICETSGSHCIGASSLGLDQTVEEVKSKDARQLVLDKLLHKWNNYDKYKLEFAQDTSKCVGLSNDGNKVEVRQCTATGTDWFKQTVGSEGERWGNVYATDTLHPNTNWWVLSGIDVDNAPFHVYLVDTYGQFQKYTIK